MKEFIFKILLLFAILAVFDFVFGQLMGYVVSHITVGGQGRDNYICNKAVEDIMVFGSSRAIHHYNAQMMEDSLGLSCYNCGADGNGIILSYGRLTLAKQRHQPKVVIHDVAPYFDCYKDDNHKYLGWLKPHFDKEGIPEIFETIDPNERHKMMCQMYRYNSIFLQNLIVFFTSVTYDAGVKGFRPSNGHLNPDRVVKSPYLREYELDNQKLDFIDKFIDLADGSQLFFVFSPIWYGLDSAHVRPVKEICDRRGVTLLDYSNDPKYVGNSELFKDGTHLNAKGADEFTHDLILELRQHHIVK